MSKNGINVTPSASDLANKSGVKLAYVKGTGSAGRITVRDVRSYVSLAESNKPNGKVGLRSLYNEIGQEFDDTFWGQLNLAPTSELTWPSCYPLFSRIRRTDPEISITRQMFVSLARGATIEYVAGSTTPSDAEKKAVTFSNEVLDDMEKPMSSILETTVSYVTFYGWGYFEVVPGRRDPKWNPPDKEDEWRSRYSDGMNGIRRISWRDNSTFKEWDFTEKGRVKGMWQTLSNSGDQLIPLNKAIHLVFGDSNSPEGLSPLEAVWRLERIKFALEFIQGRGYENAAGHAKFVTEDNPDDDDLALVKAAAYALMSAREGNHIILPKSIEGELVDVRFSVASSILDAIKYYSMLKLQLFAMQWVAMSTTSGSGSFAAMKDSTGMFMTYFNAMLGGFVEQMDVQLTKQIARYNPSIYAGLEFMPKLQIIPMSKARAVTDIAGFYNTISTIFPLGEEDEERLREFSDGLLSDTLGSEQEGFEPEPDIVEEEEIEEEGGEDEEAEGEGGGTNFDQEDDEARLARVLFEFNQQMRSRQVTMDTDGTTRSFGSVKKIYHDTVSDAVSRYFATPGSYVVRFRNRIKLAVANLWAETFADGYSECGKKVIDPEDLLWLSSRQAEEFGHIDSMFAKLKEIRKDGDSDEMNDQPEIRATGYTNTLESIYTEARFRGCEKRMLTFVGDDGKESCTTCSRWKNKRHSSKFWLKRGLIPAPGNTEFECSGYNCKHYFVDDDGDAVGLYE